MRFRNGVNVGFKNPNNSWYRDQNEAEEAIYGEISKYSKYVNFEALPASPSSFIKHIGEEIKNYSRFSDIDSVKKHLDEWKELREIVLEAKDIINLKDTTITKAINRLKN